jgi:TRAP-type C4-dicarboxylate transport system permease small subunit
LAAIVWVGSAISTLLILAILAIVSYAVFMRYAIERPILWGDDMIGNLLVAFVMLGTAEAYRRGDHISVDLLAARLGDRAGRLLAVWSNVAVLLFAVTLAISAWQAIMFARMFDSYTQGGLEIPSWIPQVPLLVGAVLLGTIAVARLAGIDPGAAAKDQDT